MSFQRNIFLFIFLIIISGCTSTNNDNITPLLHTKLMSVTEINIKTITKEPTIINNHLLESSTPSKTDMMLPSDTITNTPFYPTAGNKRFSDTDGTTKYSYIPPLGWSRIPPSNGIGNLWVLFDEKPSRFTVYVCTLVLSVNYYGDLSAEDLAKHLLIDEPPLNSEIDYKGKFSPNSGVDAYKVILYRTFTDGNASFIYYYFHKGEATIISEYVRRYGEHLEQDKIIENSMKTFTFE
jgi:hypothetical protein